MSPELGTIAHASVWLRKVVEGQDLIAIPKLHVEHHAALKIINGMSLSALFSGCRLVTESWDDDAGFVGGSWMLWRTSRPELLKAGFVRGQVKFNIEHAVRGVVGLLE